MLLGVFIQIYFVVYKLTNVTRANREAFKRYFKPVDVSSDRAPFPFLPILFLCRSIYFFSASDPQRGLYEVTDLLAAINATVYNV